MTDQASLVARLRNPAFVHAGTAEPKLDEVTVLRDMREAADEIERLQRLAGAVSPGESFQEIRDGVNVRRTE